MARDSGKSPSKSSEIRKRGNDLFLQKNRDDYRTVLSLYSKSIAYAPPNSEELAQGLGNRSALWWHLQKYDLCLLDIGRALSITKSNGLVQKLLSRKEKCLEHVSALSIDSQEESSYPKITSSNSVLCGADSIELKFNKKYGRHYIATRDIKPGEIIMIEKTPYTFVDLEQMYLICSHCLAFAWAGVPCDSCIFTIYCSETCRQEAWSQYHDILCIMYSNNSFRDRILNCEREREMQTPSLLNGTHSTTMNLLRMLIIMIKKEGLNEMMKTAEDIDKAKLKDSEQVLDPTSTRNCTDFKFVYSLMASKRDLNDLIATFDASLLLSAFKEYSDEKYNHLSLGSLQILSEELLKICMGSSIKFSSHDCHCEDSRGGDCFSVRGDILAPCSALFNWSCDYNVNGIFASGPKIILFANRPIAQGEQLFTNSGLNASIPKDHRQDLLKMLHSFTCECIVCTEDWPAQKLHRITGMGFKKVLLKHGKALGDEAMKFAEVPIKFSRKIFDASTEILEYIYENFNLKEASGHAHFYQRYITRYLDHLYGNDLDLHHIHSIFATAQANAQEYLQQPVGSFE